MRERPAPKTRAFRFNGVEQARGARARGARARAFGRINASSKRRRALDVLAARESAEEIVQPALVPVLAGDGALVHRHVRERLEREDVADDERRFAESVLEANLLEPGRADLLYARVDLIRDGDTLRLMELELVEPSLFLKQHPPALERLTDALLRRA